MAKSKLYRLEDEDCYDYYEHGASPQDAIENAVRSGASFKDGDILTVYESIERGAYKVSIAPPVTVPRVVTVKKVKK
jgi:hypothetical protein